MIGDMRSLIMINVSRSRSEKINISEFSRQYKPPKTTGSCSCKVYFTHKYSSQRDLSEK